ncbi:MAG: urea carboxylase-associated family protein [Hyphomicrobiales bacterium]|nr:urea carboxylase-associated family protein [Hyphomicrobiales bacterium]
MDERMPPTPRRPQDLSDEQLGYYARVRDDVAVRTPLEKVYVRKRTGHALRLAQHQIIRITCCEGPQVCDFNAFAEDDPAEYFWSGRTRTLYGSHLKVGQRLWGTEPKMRPMLTFIADTVKKQSHPFNATSHDLLYSRCSERRVELRTGLRHQPNCNDNLKHALEAIGFRADHVHDAFNIFMTTGCDDEHRLFYVDPEAVKGDYVELYAEIDLVCAVSCCPGASSGSEPHGLLLETFEQPHRHDWEVVRP